MGSCQQSRRILHGLRGCACQPGSWLGISLHQALVRKSLLGNFIWAFMSAKALCKRTVILLQHLRLGCNFPEGIAHSNTLFMTIFIGWQKAEDTHGCVSIAYSYIRFHEDDTLSSFNDLIFLTSSLTRSSYLIDIRRMYGMTSVFCNFTKQILFNIYAEWMRQASCCWFYNTINEVNYSTEDTILNIYDNRYFSGCLQPIRY